MGVALDLREFLESRDISHAAAGVLAGVARSTITLIVNGKTRARPATVVKLAKALGVNAKRMQQMCEVHYAETHPEEVVVR